MTDPRVKDAVRKLARDMDSLLLAVSKLAEDNVYMKEQLRAIKKSVVRKYDKKSSIVEKITGKKDES